MNSICRERVHFIFFLDLVIITVCSILSNRNPQFIGLSVTRKAGQLVRKPTVVAKTGVPKQDLGMCLPKIFSKYIFLKFFPKVTPLIPKR